jgi:thymidylate synthase (FAD)
MTVEFVNPGVKLQWITPDAEKQIAYMARVSNPANQENYDTSHKLLAYCIRNRHWSIFEMAAMCVEITTTRAIARQILRHRSFSFQEFSGRYAVQQDWMQQECRLQDPKNRQNSIDNTPWDLSDWWTLIAQEEVRALAEKHYREALARGIAKEVARSILPEGLIASKMYMNGTVRSWLHFLSVRGAEKAGAQKEHRLLALEVGEILRQNLPSVHSAYLECYPLNPEVSTE